MRSSQPPSSPSVGDVMLDTPRARSATEEELRAVADLMARRLLRKSRLATAIPYFNFSEGTAMFTKLIHAFALLATALALSACNTMTGVGKDVEQGGQKLQEESKEVQHKM